ncbi:alpha/beta-hydrolase [Auriscalpium vulgare]|uniref:Alpha/beta-hydrolase n=1 Tax=Auriscalpium vulgare TaxID=40419 RepID=A0ACB8RXK1_9AGAM|nr:alpha/beta-hydrolase [Auriscalpium vulgare]
MAVTVKKQTFNVGGLEVHVHLKADLLSSKAEGPVAALIALHGRTGSCRDFDETAQAIFKWADEAASSGKNHRDFIFVTFDQRNHGARTVDAFANGGWDKEPEKHNQRHALDMYAIQTGTARDVSFVIDYLPAYVFPNDERTISEWAVAGVSLGGHAAWLTLRNEPRVRIGIPIIGCPDYLTLIDLRADKHGIPLAPPYMPESLRTIVHRDDPASAGFRSTKPGENPFLGKRILVLSGEADTLVPWVASSDFVEGLEVGEGRKKVLLLNGVKHEYTPEMIRELFEFFWEESLAV